MASNSAPATPVGAAQTVASGSPTGTWVHPRFDEIHRRLNATTFGERNVKQILWRLPIVALAALSPNINALLHQYLALDIAKPLIPYLVGWVRLTIYAVLLSYALWPLSPLFFEMDDLSDIPLTPSQRALLGLKPSSQPATPGEKYITPPRYARSSTPRSVSASQSGSPLSGRGSPGSGFGGASYSPSPSPLFQKAVGRDATRRLSYGSPSPLSISKGFNDSTGSLVLPTTPSPSSGRGASVSLNSRWLYERGRSGSGLRSVYS